MNYFLLVTYHDIALGPNNPVRLGFPTMFLRGLHAILLSRQPCDLRYEDR